MQIGYTVTSPRGTIEVAVLVDGVEQMLYRRPWDGKVFVAGAPGVAYVLRVRNCYPDRRIEVINTVDGRHTLKDEPGDLRRNQGLVFSNGYTGRFTGWRLNDDQTREFVFGAPGGSIAAQATGSTENVGVIGFAVYTEHGVALPLPHISPELTRSSKFGSEITGLGMARGGSLGTGMGAIQQDQVGHTNFTRSRVDPDVLVIGYDTEKVLREQGIIAPAEADPFPGIQTGYADFVPMQ